MIDPEEINLRHCYACGGYHTDVDACPQPRSNTIENICTSVDDTDIDDWLTRNERIHMADLTREQMKLLDEHDQHQQRMMKEQLSQLGIQLRIQHFTGDNSYPVEFTLRYSFVSVTQPTFGLALSAFVEQLLKFVPIEKAVLPEQT